MWPQRTLSSSSLVLNRGNVAIADFFIVVVMALRER